MGRTYQEELADIYKKKKLELAKITERRIISLYDNSILDIAKKLEKEKSELKRSFLEGRMKQLYNELDKLIKESTTAAAYMSNDFNKELMDRITRNAGVANGFSNLFKGVPLRTIKAMENGSIYSDGLGLSKRIWGYTRSNISKVDEIIKQGLIQGTSAKELAQILSEHVNPASRKIWPRKKLKEKLGKGYAYSKSLIDYNAMRLARTSISHAFSLNNRLASEKNPFIDGFIWHSAGVHGRTCSICSEREGKHYAAKDMPYDHPNGLCWEEPYIKESIEDISKELGDWAKGGTNKRLDDWWNNQADGAEKPKPQKVGEKDFTPRPKKRTFEDMERGFRDKGATTDWVRVKRSIQKSPEFIQDWYEQYGKNLRFDDIKAKNGAWYSPGTRGITMHLWNDRKNERGAYSTFFHEFGHMLDHQTKKGTILSKDPRFIKAIKEDYQDKLNSGLLKNKSKTFINRELTEMLRDDGDLASGVQDIYSGLTLNKVRPGWGHSTSYWKRGNTDHEIASEAFAHMSSGFTNPDRLEYMKKWFPKSCDAFEEIIKENLK